MSFCQQTTTHLSSWKPPSSSARTGAVGKLKRPLALAAACRVEPCYPRFCAECQPTALRIPNVCCGHTRHSPGSFAPKVHPERYDWFGDEDLGGDDRTGQTFAEFVQQQSPSKQMRHENSRTVLYLWNLDAGVAGGVDEATTIMLREFCELYFERPCRALFEPLDDKEETKLQRSGQTTAGTIERMLYQRRQDLPDAWAVVGVTSRVDLCATMADTLFEYGEACPDKGVAVVSLARFSVDSDTLAENETASSVLLLRAFKILAHEVGHLFGLQHCVFYQCVMNGWAHLEELDESPVSLCPVCLRKWFAVSDRNPQFDVVKRYQRLATAMEERWGQMAVAAWYTAAAQRCQDQLANNRKTQTKAKT